MSRIFLTIVLSVCSFGISAVPAFAANESNYTYLALGDSVAFGMNIALLNPALPPPRPDQFTGYPEIVAQIQHLAQSKKLMNASCPGETSTSFLNPYMPDGGCNSPHQNPFVPPFKVTFGLHAAYTTSQVNFAVSQLSANKHINLVTLGIGGDDLLLLQESCANPNPALFQACVLTGLGTQATPGPVLTAYASNLAQILTAIRYVAGYNGTLVLVTYYSPATDPLTTLAIQALNTVMTQVGAGFNVKIADGFTAFQIASLPSGDPCTAGLLNPNPFPPFTPPCDVHPSLKGSAVLADAVLAAIGAKH